MLRDENYNNVSSYLTIDSPMNMNNFILILIFVPVILHFSDFQIYGEFLCHFIPIGQVLGNLTSSLALLVIALDRYHNVIHALRPKWNPKPYICLLGTAVLWLVCAGKILHLILLL